MFKKRIKNAKGLFGGLFNHNKVAVSVDFLNLKRKIENFLFAVRHITRERKFRGREVRKKNKEGLRIRIVNFVLFKLRATSLKLSSYRVQDINILTTANESNKKKQSVVLSS